MDIRAPRAYKRKSHAWVVTVTVVENKKTKKKKTCMDPSDEEKQNQYMAWMINETGPNEKKDK